MIEPVYETRRALRPWTDWERLRYQINEGRVRVGPEAAREIAKRIERQHGFWDLRKQKGAV
jgi:hypothetical protein